LHIEPMLQAAISGCIASARAPGGVVVKPERLRSLIEEAVNRYHTETRGNAGPTPLSEWSRTGTGRRG
jgi:hypothetical protein